MDSLDPLDSLRIILAYARFLFATIFRTGGIYYNGVRCYNIPKMSNYMAERLIGRTVVIVYVLVLCSLEYGTWGWGLS